MPARSPEEVLRDAGLQPGPVVDALDEARGLSLVTWRRW
jgi:hypothetical protein